MKGARTPGSGRRAGTPNKNTAAIRALAQEHGPDAIAFFADVMNDDSRAVEARLAAARELLNRGYGKPSLDVDVRLHVSRNLSGLSLSELAERAESIAARLRAQADAERAARMAAADTASRLQLPATLEAVIVENDAPQQG